MVLSEQEIIGAIREGNERIFEETFRKYYQSLCNYANSILKEMDEAEEVVQNLFLSIWEKRSDLEISISLKSYLYRAVHNHCLNRIKHLKVREEYQQYAVNFYDASYESVSQTVMKNELETKIEEAIKKLPEQCRLIFQMSRFEELKYHEIAEQLELSPKTVENQIGKALKILRVELAEYLPLIIICGTT
ncbi:MAG: RNA polymerase sigma-70 factor, partial [Emticicia sp.]|uniref:RNA polymerase sigma-70 factor n=1 Tax=Emticicia sp. TaxID=1930953 RepID=UPI003BA6B564